MPAPPKNNLASAIVHLPPPRGRIAILRSGTTEVAVALDGDEGPRIVPITEVGGAARRLDEIQHLVNQKLPAGGSAAENRYAAALTLFEKAGAYLRAAVSGIREGCASYAAVQYRHITCHGTTIEGERLKAPCAFRAVGADGKHYCQPCSCGEWRAARLDLEDPQRWWESKLAYRKLACPKGFWPEYSNLTIEGHPAGMKPEPSHPDAGSPQPPAAVPLWGGRAFMAWRFITTLPGGLAALVKNSTRRKRVRIDAGGGDSGLNKTAGA